MTLEQLAAKWEADADALAEREKTAPSLVQGVSYARQADTLRMCAQQLRSEIGVAPMGVSFTCPHCGQDAHVEVSGDDQELPCPECRELLRVRFF